MVKTVTLELNVKQANALRQLLLLVQPQIQPGTVADTFIIQLCKQLPDVVTGQEMRATPQPVAPTLPAGLPEATQTPKASPTKQEG